MCDSLGRRELSSCSFHLVLLDYVVCKNICLLNPKGIDWIEWRARGGGYPKLSYHRLKFSEMAYAGIG